MDKQKLEKANRLEKEINFAQHNVDEIDALYKDKVALYRGPILCVWIPNALKEGILKLVRDYYNERLENMKEELEAL